MASDSAHSYIHNDSLGNFDDCRKNQDILGDRIQALYNEGRIMGFQLIIIEDGLQEIDEFIFFDDPAIKNGKYPYLFIRIQPNENSEINVDGIMNNYNATRIQ